MLRANRARAGPPLGMAQNKYRTRTVQYQRIYVCCTVSAFCELCEYLPFNTHTTEYFKNAKKFKLTDLYEYQISKHMFKCLNLNANILPRHSDIHNYPTRNNNKFIAPKCNMRKSEMSINFKSIKVWNKLPAGVCTAVSLNVFVDNLRKYFLSLY